MFNATKGPCNCLILTSSFWEILIRSYSIRFYMMQGDGNVLEGEERSMEV